MTNMGYPSTGVFTDPAITNVQVGLPVSTQHENVYVYDGADLYLRYWDGTSWQPWENLGLINK